ncbi:SCO2102 family sporulation regulator [Streptomyces sp. MAR25Y5]|uniref:SCO2102 family sporulation regulator n=1 Tax=Streptomyces sp. MAR25Y5 TaxID=2962028 RepID=UPI0020B73E23|nr:hypothetical protein [Streptomyces sp. MAR25Y5]MCP3765930.1 hypothetical protein [Streptomyces sp. MAR25Y5]
MGWTVLYIAFGVVALWLLGEVLLQYKARLRWRLLAFAGFLGVVLGVLLQAVLVIGLGAVAFAIGQTYVTLSFRRGFAAGWAVNAPLLSAVKGGRGDRGRKEPTLEVSGLEATGDGYGDEGAERRRDRDSYGADDDYDRDDVFTPVRGEQRTAAETTAVYEPQPMPDDTGSYGVYDDNGYGTPAQDQYAATAQSTDQGYDTGQNHAYDYSGYGQQQSYDTTGQQQYAAYSDPYIGNPTYGGASYDTGYTDSQQQYGQQGYGQDQYGGDYGGETLAGGLWVPQQRSTDDLYGGELPQEQPYPYQADGPQGQAQGNGNGNGNGYDEQQYRY